MGGPQTEEPPGTHQDTVVDNGTAGPLPRKSDGADGTRSKNGIHLRHEYNLLVSEAM